MSMHGARRCGAAFDGLCLVPSMIEFGAHAKARSGGAAGAQRAAAAIALHALHASRGAPRRFIALETPNEYRTGCDRACGFSRCCTIIQRDCHAPVDRVVKELGDDLRRALQADRVALFRGLRRHLCRATATAADRGDLMYAMRAILQPYRDRRGCKRRTRSRRCAARSLNALRCAAVCACRLSLLLRGRLGLQAAM